LGRSHHQTWDPLNILLVLLLAYLISV
jgi:hypothetical protein